MTINKPNGRLIQKKIPLSKALIPIEKILTRNSFFFIGIFIILVFIQIIHNIDLFKRDFVELADFASNSILVDDAKKLKLLHGHYSRIGFYHPGPAIFYFQALGEWLVYDILSLAQSPFAGQAFGLFLYVALLLSLSVYCLKLLLSEWQAVFFLSSLVLMLNIFLYPTNFSSPWFPHLFAITFLPFIISWIAVYLNKIRALPIFSFCSMLLFHGHIAFSMFVGAAWTFILINTINIIIANQISFRNYISMHSRILWLSFGIILFGILPILLHTILHFPGEILKYLTYSPDISNHTWPKALKFVAFYWIHSTKYPDTTEINFIIFFIFIFLICTLISLIYLKISLTCLKTNIIITSGLSRGITLTTGIITALTLFYARYKIDTWSDHYTIIFYSSSILLIVSIFIARITLTFFEIKKLLKFSLIMTMIAIVTWPKYSVYSIEKTALKPFFQAIKSKAVTGPVEIEVDYSREPPSQAWIYIVALLMNANREGINNICVLESTWALAYHERNKCNQSNKRQKLFIGLQSYAENKNVLATIDDIALWE